MPSSGNREPRFTLACSLACNLAYLFWVYAILVYTKINIGRTHTLPVCLLACLPASRLKRYARCVVWALALVCTSRETENGDYTRRCVVNEKGKQHARTHTHTSTIQPAIQLANLPANLPASHPARQPVRQPSSHSANHHTCIFPCIFTSPTTQHAGAHSIQRAQRSTAQHNTTQHSTTQHNTPQQRSLIADFQIILEGKRCTGRSCYHAGISS